MNAVEIDVANLELALQFFDAVDFSFAFLAAFGNKATAPKRLRSGNNIHLAVCEAGTVDETPKVMRCSSATTKSKTKFMLATDEQALGGEELVACAEEFLLDREALISATVSDNLRRAHERNDEVLEPMYIGRRFKHDAERMDKLFELCTKMTADASNAKPGAKAPRGKKP